jgi:hypothetical protein
MQNDHKVPKLSTGNPYNPLRDALDILQAASRVEGNPA